MTVSLVTGGAGFIGSHLTHALLARGDQVRVLDNFSTGKRENLNSNPNLEILEGDLRDQAQVADAVRGVDLVFHHAAFISVPLSMQDPQTCLEVNVEGTSNLLEAARKAGVRQVVLASSAAVYGDADSIPLKEDTPLGALSPYAASKQMNEVYAGLYTRAFDLPVIALRYFNVYGPRQSPQSDYAAVIPIWARRMLDGEPPLVYGDGGQGRDFIYVEDVVRANLLATENTPAPGQVFNICGGQEISLLDLLDVLEELIPNAPSREFAPPRAGDIYRSVGDASRAAAVLGFKAQTNLVDGLAQVVAWMRS